MVTEARVQVETCRITCGICGWRAVYVSSILEDGQEPEQYFRCSRHLQPRERAALKAGVGLEFPAGELDGYPR